MTIEIEIITTKKKLTKSIINQMIQASVYNIDQWEVLGYVINVVKGSKKSLLIKYNDGYLTFPCNWEKGEKSIYRKIGKWSISNKFDLKEECDEFWRIYSKILREAVQIYI